MEEMQVIVNKIIENRFFNSIIIIIISFLIYRFVSLMFVKGDKKNVVKNSKSKTYIKMLRSILRYVFITITVLIILQINGVNVSSMLAGVGILSVIVGFAVQDVLKDIIKGLDIISDSYFHVGDIIKYKDIEGKVLVIGLKTTKIENIKNLNVVSIANRNIEQVEVVSNSIDILIPMPYELKVEDAEEVIYYILEKVKELENVDSYKYRGVSEFADSSIKYQINIRCKPELRLQTRRDVLRCILTGLEEKGIEIPYNQIDVHQK